MMKQSNQGYSLIELVVSVAIFSVISAAALGFCSFIINIYYSTMRQEQVFNEHSIINYACKTVIKQAQYYTISEDQTVYLGKEDPQSSEYKKLELNQYIAETSDYISNLEIEVKEGLIEIYYTISLANEKADYNIQFMAPLEYVESP